MRTSTSSSCSVESCLSSSSQSWLAQELERRDLDKQLYGRYIQSMLQMDVSAVELDAAIGKNDELAWAGGKGKRVVKGRRKAETTRGEVYGLLGERKQVALHEAVWNEQENETGAKFRQASGSCNSLPETATSGLKTGGSLDSVDRFSAKRNMGRRSASSACARINLSDIDDARIHMLKLDLRPNFDGERDADIFCEELSDKWKMDKVHKVNERSSQDVCRSSPTSGDPWKLYNAAFPPLSIECDSLIPTAVVQDGRQWSDVAQKSPPTDISNKELLSTTKPCEDQLNQNIKTVTYPGDSAGCRHSERAMPHRRQVWRRRSGSEKGGHARRRKYRPADVPGHYFDALPLRRRHADHRGHSGTHRLFFKPFNAFNFHNNTVPPPTMMNYYMYHHPASWGGYFTPPAAFSSYDPMQSASDVVDPTPLSSVHLMSQSVCSDLKGSSKQEMRRRARIPRVAKKSLSYKDKFQLDDDDEFDADDDDEYEDDVADEPRIYRVAGSGVISASSKRLFSDDCPSATSSGTRQSTPCHYGNSAITADHGVASSVTEHTEVAECILPVSDGMNNYYTAGFQPKIFGSSATVSAASDVQQNTALATDFELTVACDDIWKPSSSSSSLFFATNLGNDGFGSKKVTRNESDVFNSSDGFLGCSRVSCDTAWTNSSQVLQGCPHASGSSSSYIPSQKNEACRDFRELRLGASEPWPGDAGGEILCQDEACVGLNILDTTGWELDHCLSDSPQSDYTIFENCWKPSLDSNKDFSTQFSNSKELAPTSDFSTSNLFHCRSPLFGLQPNLGNFVNTPLVPFNSRCSSVLPDDNGIPCPAEQHCNLSCCSPLIVSQSSSAIKRLSGAESMVVTSEKSRDGNDRTDIRKIETEAETNCLFDNRERKLYNNEESLINSRVREFDQFDLSEMLSKTLHKLLDCTISGGAEADIAGNDDRYAFDGNVCITDEDFCSKSRYPNDISLQFQKSLDANEFSYAVHSTSDSLTNHLGARMNSESPFACNKPYLHDSLLHSKTFTPHVSDNNEALHGECKDIIVGACDDLILFNDLDSVESNVANSSLSFYCGQECEINSPGAAVNGSKILPSKDWYTISSGVASTDTAQLLQSPGLNNRLNWECIWQDGALNWDTNLGIVSGCNPLISEPSRSAFQDQDNGSPIGLSSQNACKSRDMSVMVAESSKHVCYGLDHENGTHVNTAGLAVKLIVIQSSPIQEQFLAFSITSRSFLDQLHYLFPYRAPLYSVSLSASSPVLNGASEMHGQANHSSVLLSKLCDLSGIVSINHLQDNHMQADSGTAKQVSDVLTGADAGFLACHSASCVKERPTMPYGSEVEIGHTKPECENKYCPDLQCLSCLSVGNVSSIGELDSLTHCEQLEQYYAVSESDSSVILVMKNEIASNMQCVVTDANKLSNNVACNDYWNYSDDSQSDPPLSDVESDDFEEFECDVSHCIDNKIGKDYHTTSSSASSSSGSSSDSFEDDQVGAQGCHLRRVSNSLATFTKHDSENCKQEGGERFFQHFITVEDLSKNNNLLSSMESYDSLSELPDSSMIAYGEVVVKRDHGKLNEPFPIGLVCDQSDCVELAAYPVTKREMSESSQSIDTESRMIEEPSVLKSPQICADLVENLLRLVDDTSELEPPLSGEFSGMTQDNIHTSQSNDIGGPIRLVGRSELVPSENTAFSTNIPRRISLYNTGNAPVAAASSYASVSHHQPIVRSSSPLQLVYDYDQSILRQVDFATETDLCEDDIGQLNTSPSKQFRPISCTSPDNDASESEVLIAVPSLPKLKVSDCIEAGATYQSYATDIDGDEDELFFRPMFKVVNDQEKSVQTGEATPLVQHVVNEMNDNLKLTTESLNNLVACDESFSSPDDNNLSSVGALGSVMSSQCSSMAYVNDDVCCERNNFSFSSDLLVGKVDSANIPGGQYGRGSGANYNGQGLLEHLEMGQIEAPGDSSTVLGISALPAQEQHHLVSSSRPSWEHGSVMYSGGTREQAHSLSAYNYNTDSYSAPVNNYNMDDFRIDPSNTYFADITSNTQYHCSTETSALNVAEQSVLCHYSDKGKFTQKVQDAQSLSWNNAAINLGLEYTPACEKQDEYNASIAQVNRSATEQELDRFDSDDPAWVCAADEIHRLLSDDEIEECRSSSYALDDSDDMLCVALNDTSSMLARDPSKMPATVFNAYCVEDNSCTATNSVKVSSCNFDADEEQANYSTTDPLAMAIRDNNSELHFTLPPPCDDRPPGCRAGNVSFPVKEESIEQKESSWPEPPPVPCSGAIMVGFLLDMQQNAVSLPAVKMNLAYMMSEATRPEFGIQGFGSTKSSCFGPSDIGYQSDFVHHDSPSSADVIESVTRATQDFKKLLSQYAVLPSAPEAVYSSELEAMWHTEASVLCSSNDDYNSNNCASEMSKELMQKIVGSDCPLHPELCVSSLTSEALQSCGRKVDNTFNGGLQQPFSLTYDLTSVRTAGLSENVHQRSSSEMTTSVLGHVQYDRGSARQEEEEEGQSSSGEQQRRRPPSHPSVLPPSEWVNSIPSKCIDSPYWCFTPEELVYRVTSS